MELKREFFVKTNCFLLAKTIKEHAEEKGWEYSDYPGGVFNESNLKGRCSGFYFSVDWANENGKPKFGLSNSSENVFELPDDWDKAIITISSLDELIKAPKTVFIGDDKLVKYDDKGFWKVGCAIFHHNWIFELVECVGDLNRLNGFHSNGWSEENEIKINSVEINNVSVSWKKLLEVYKHIKKN